MQGMRIAIGITEGFQANMCTYIGYITQALYCLIICIAFVADLLNAARITILVMKYIQLHNHLYSSIFLLYTCLQLH